LKYFLEKKGYSFTEHNPLLVKNWIQRKTLRRTKTDKSDCVSIAAYTADNPYAPYPKDFHRLASLKSLTRLREGLMKEHNRYAVWLTNVLDCVFPEFKPFFKNKFCVTALFILENYGSPEKISHMNSQSYDNLRRISRGHLSLGRFTKLKNLAKTTVGVWNNIYGLELETVLGLYKNINDQIKKLESEITVLVEEINPPTLSVRGIGAVSAAVIIAEFGGITKFSSPAKMLAFAGLEPGTNQSGTSDKGGKMVKRGSSHLRAVLMNCARSVKLHNFVFSEYYWKKRNEGKSDTVANSHVAKKLLRVIFALETNNIRFQSNLLR
jgi:transposase